MNRKIFGLSLISLLFGGAQLLTAKDAPTFIYLIDPSDQATIAAFAQDQKDTNGTNSVSKSTGTNSVPTVSTNSLPPDPITKTRTLDDVIEDAFKKPPMTKSQERILKQVTAEQMEFLHLLDQFIATPFDPADDQAKPEFNKIRDRIVTLVFNASTERFFYERLFLINKSWLEHSTEIARYASLDKSLRDRSLVLEERSRRFRQIITGVAAVGGAVGGGFLSYKAAQKILPVVATEKGFSTIVRWAGRGTIVFIGAGVGAIVGAEIGFLGSEYLFRRRDYINPIDGNQDLRDMLSVIESL
ncbi:MAG: hypothetical protein JWQ35_1807 [Bacteriovoracaceae bacterium]|nr:hypothetical protein [Bacteriovoracaceae bacterium]